MRSSCECLLSQALTSGGQFSTAAGVPSGTADCLQGNLCAAFLDLGVEAPRLRSAYEWMARTVTGEGLAGREEKHAELRYFAGKCGPLFACGSNNRLPCAWGAAKVIRAFGKLPPDERTPLIEHAIQAGTDFLLSVDVLKAEYPNGWSEKPSGNWWKLGFPVLYVTDLLQVVEVLVDLGHGHDPRLRETLAWIGSKANSVRPLAAGVCLHWQNVGGFWSEESA